jgi:predicted methyltransferase
MKKLVFIGLLLTFFSQSGLAKNSNTIVDVMSGTHRSAEHKARDIYRHPKQTLEFFSVNPDMTVVEIWPGGKGWYTEILAPYLKGHGKLYAAHFAADSDVPYFQDNLKNFLAKTKAQPEIYSKLIMTELNPPDKLAIAPEGSVDRVLTFRNVHNWIKKKQALKVFKAMFLALKPGGILGVVEHRSAPQQKDPEAVSGYIAEEYVIVLAKEAGFELLARSEINANPKDTKNHPEGVWTLPPTLRLKDKDREKYLAIGESDRMTLKFVKGSRTK